jgi:hypothetical protein
MDRDPQGFVELPDTPDRILQPPTICHSPFIEGIASTSRPHRNGRRCARDPDTA